MAPPPGHSYRIVCPGCKASLKAWPEQAGTQIKCPQCARMMVVPTAAEAAAPPPPPSVPADQPAGDDEYALASGDWQSRAKASNYINVICPICSTRMYTTADQIGQSLVCPDCGTSVKVTAPPPGTAAEDKPAHPHVIYEGSEEYGVLLGEGPARSDSAADQGVQIPVICPLCHTRMYASAREVGRKKVCPDCGTLAIVPRPPKPEPKPAHRPVVFEGSDEYAVRKENVKGPAKPPGDEDDQIPVVCPLCHTRMHARRDLAGKRLVCPDCGKPVKVPPAPARAPKFQIESFEAYGVEEPPLPPPPPVHRPAAKDLAPQYEAGEKTPEEEEIPQDPPPWPFVTGVFRFLEVPEAWTRWVVLSLAAITVCFLMRFAYTTLVGLSGGILAAPAAAVGVMAMCVSGIFGLMGLIIATGQCLVILEQTAHGYDRIDAWPEAVWIDWVFDSFYLINSFVLAAMPGLLAAQYYAGGSSPFTRNVLIAEFFLFPVFLLSLMERGSAINPFSGSTWRAMLLAPGSWVQFYIAAAILVAALSLIIQYAMSRFSGLWVIIVGPAGTLGLMLYFRLLGRLAWCCSSALRRAEPEEEEEEDTEE